MKLTEEEFNEWRQSRVTGLVFEVLAHRAKEMEARAKEAAWTGGFDEDEMAVERAKCSMLTQFVTMTYEDFSSIAWRIEE